MNITIDSDLSMQTVIWRYIDISKLLDLLVTQELHFSRVDKFKDPFDSSFASFFVPTDQNRNQLDDIRRQEEDCRRKLYINCWSSSQEEVESAVLWNYYMQNQNGVVLKSSIGSLRCAINKSSHVDGPSIRVGKVKYSVPDLNSIMHVSNELVVLTKRKSFGHENEVRAWIEVSQDSPVYQYSDDDKSGIRIPVNLISLIRGLYVHPEAPDWIEKCIRITVEKFIPMHTFEIAKSKLYSIK